MSRLGEMLRKEKIITKKQLEAVLEELFITIVVSPGTTYVLKLAETTGMTSITTKIISQNCLLTKTPN